MKLDQAQKDYIRTLMEAARNQGWTVLQTKSHLKWVPPDKTKPIVVTPGFHAGRGIEPREFLNVRAQLRRSGLSV